MIGIVTRRELEQNIEKGDTNERNGAKEVERRQISEVNEN